MIERLNKEAIEGETESAKVLSIQFEMPSGPDAEWSMVFLRRYYVIRVGTDIVQSLRVGVGGRHKNWVKTGGKKFVEHIGLIRVRCSSGRFIMKSVRDCRAAKFELSDSCPEFLVITSVAGKVLKEISFSDTDLIYNAVAEGSIFQQPVMAFSTFEFPIQAVTLADCKSDFTVNPGGVGFNRN